MDGLREIYTRLKKMIIFILAFYVIGLGFTSYQEVFAGLIIGTLFGIYNMWILVRRMEKFDRAVAEGSKVRSLGTALRFASGIAAVAIAILFAEHIHLVSTVIGLMVPYALLLTERIVYHVKHH
ncbi:ATP synthase protein I [Planococcus halocryophilus Or1]|uniref:ATP synthase subunit n=1 Tax=Planococcus halocryophilus TaxID=1215089 RepID=A0A1C7DRJ7_9BACL|nr:ATP synthase subunit I [Planococcus halocryophilus]ANU14024.1 ATP synthase subunit [Planococcus halocryophilus]EMF47376.1 ATP synthase protein I [Planococcus halocryophilus Or1]MCH4826871.1 ATP synthase subunit I [Planococcus halocryophilus]